MVRYQRERPGELIHIDVKKLGRIQAVGHRITGDPRDRRRDAGWEYVHVCIDDASRLAYSKVLAEECKASAVAFLDWALNVRSVSLAWVLALLQGVKSGSGGLCL